MLELDWTYKAGPQFHQALVTRSGAFIDTLQIGCLVNRTKPGGGRWLVQGLNQNKWLFCTEPIHRQKKLFSKIVDIFQILCI